MLEAKQQNRIKPFSLANYDALCSLVADMPELKLRLYEQLTLQRLFIVGEQNEISPTLLIYPLSGDQNLREDMNRCLHVYTTRELAKKQLDKANHHGCKVIELDGKKLKDMVLGIKPETVHLAVHCAGGSQAVIIENMTLRSLDFDGTSAGQTAIGKKLIPDPFSEIRLTEDCVEALARLFRMEPGISSVAVCNNSDSEMRPIFLFVINSPTVNTGLLLQPIKEIFYDYDYNCTSIRFGLIFDQTIKELTMFRRACSFGIEIF